MCITKYYLEKDNQKVTSFGSVIKPNPDIGRFNLNVATTNRSTKIVEVFL
jgi:hypothetical protein